MNKDEIVQIILAATIYHSVEGTSGYRISTEDADKIYSMLKLCGFLKDNKSPEPSASESINEVQCGKCGWKGDHLIKHICEPKSTEPSQEKVDEVTLLNRKIDYIAANAVRIDGVALDQTNEWTLSKWLNPEIANAKL